MRVGIGKALAALLVVCVPGGCKGAIKSDKPLLVSNDASFLLPSGAEVAGQRLEDNHVWEREGRSARILVVDGSCRISAQDRVGVGVRQLSLQADQRRPIRRAGEREIRPWMCFNQMSDGFRGALDVVVERVKKKNIHHRDTECTAQPSTATQRGHLRSSYHARSLRCATGPSICLPASVGSIAKQEFKRRYKRMHAKHADGDGSAALPAAQCRQPMFGDQTRGPRCVGRTGLSACFACICLHLR